MRKHEGEMVCMAAARSHQDSDDLEAFVAVCADVGMVSRVAVRATFGLTVQPEHSHPGGRSSEPRCVLERRRHEHISSFLRRRETRAELQVPGVGADAGCPGSVATTSFPWHVQPASAAERRRQLHMSTSLRRRWTWAGSQDLAPAGAATTAPPRHAIPAGRSSEPLRRRHEHISTSRRRLRICELSHASVEFRPPPSCSSK
mmetsp:Transcript_100798/g.284271  ORF Transcript_100798/g.284271 Transcript_100798/m.284271 type:complete len:202 (+) Transcript_100798:1595-2200(+)